MAAVAIALNTTGCRAPESQIEPSRPTDSGHTQTFEPRTFAPFPSAIETSKPIDNQFESIFYSYRLKLTSDWRWDSPEKKNEPVIFTRFTESGTNIDLSVRVQKNYPYTTQEYAEKLATFAGTKVAEQPTFSVVVGNEDSASFEKDSAGENRKYTVVVVWKKTAFEISIEGKIEEIKKLRGEIQGILNTFAPFEIHSSSSGNSS